MNQLVRNPQTGFLESISPSFTGFTSAKKVKFLQLAHEMAEKGQMPAITSLCKAVDIAYKTFYAHLAEDHLFKEQWEDALKKIEDRLVSVMVARGQEAGGFMDRIAWLRAYSPHRWNPQQNIQISHDNGQHQKINEAVIIDIEPEMPQNGQASA